MFDAGRGPVAEHLAVDESMPMSALVSFRARNVRSYRDDTTLSLQATRLANPEVVRDVPTAAVAPDRILPAAGVFGANASGKSAILQAMADMQSVVLLSFRHGSPGSGMFRRPFLLGDDASGQATSEFEVELVLNGVRWLYGFEIDDERVHREFAYHYPHRRQALVFERDEGSLAFGSAFQSAKQFLGPFLRDNALVLSILGTAEEERIGPLFQWWGDNMGLAKSGNRTVRAVLTTGLARADATRSRVLALLRAADLGVADIEFVKPDDVLDRVRHAVHVLDGEPLDEELVEEEHLLFSDEMIQLLHRGRGRDVPFEPDDESLGTQVWVGLVGPVLQALDQGTVLLVDELDASLHPLLVAELLDLFQNPATNPRCAQLIFNTHETSILDDRDNWALGRDQIWFAEKGEDGASELHSLADFRGRRDEAVGRRYLHGRYGGVPDLDPVKFRAAGGRRFPGGA